VSTEMASIWYSSHTLLLLWMLWFFLYRDYRTDILVSKLDAIDWEITEGPGGGEWDSFRELLGKTEAGAARLTATRLLLAWLAAGYTAAAVEEEMADPSLADLRRRFTLSVASHARLSMLTKGARGFAAARIAVASLNTAHSMGRPGGGHGEGRP